MRSLLFLGADVQLDQQLAQAVRATMEPLKIPREMLDRFCLDSTNESSLGTEGEETTTRSYRERQPGVGTMCAQALHNRSSACGFRTCVQEMRGQVAESHVPVVWTG